MKKTLSSLLLLCICLSALTACAHKHSYSPEYAKDDAYHWLTCADTKCAEIFSREEHSWDGGKTTVQPTASADGVITYTCTVCSHVKNESISLKTTVTSDEWIAAFNMSNFTLNGYVTERDRQESVLMEITDDLIHTENDGYVTWAVKQDDGWHFAQNGVIGPVVNGISATVGFSVQVFHIPDYDGFTYDEISKAYVCVKGNYRYAVYFENGLIVKLEYMEDTYCPETNTGEITHCFNYTNYGTTAIELPES